MEGNQWFSIGFTKVKMSMWGFIRSEHGVTMGKTTRTTFSTNRPNLEQLPCVFSGPNRILSSP